MANAKMFLKSGHPATLLASFLYFDFSFAIWVLNGAMAPFISEQYHLTPGADRPHGVRAHARRRADALPRSVCSASTSGARTPPSWR